MVNRPAVARGRRRPVSWSIAIIGAGPRGLSVLERLLIRLRQVPWAASVVIWAVDPAEHGCGRIWRTSQDPWLTANATAAELTMRSPDSPRTTGPGGDSLAGWSAHQPAGPRFGPHDYPPRRDYGQYLHQVFEQLRTAAPAGVWVRPVPGLGLTFYDVAACLTTGRGGRFQRQLDG